MNKSKSSRSCVTSNSIHEESFKRKGSTIQDRRALRHHRRSIEWKNQRDDQFDQNRNMAVMSPVREVNSRPATPEQPAMSSAQGKKEKVSRVQMLKKWKEEKELKKKLEAMERARKQPFRVTHVQQESIPFSKPVVSFPKMAAAGNKLKAPSGRVTRASSHQSVESSTHTRRIVERPASKTRATSSKLAETKPLPKPDSKRKSAKPETVGATRRVTRSAATNKEKVNVPALPPAASRKATATTHSARTSSLKPFEKGRKVVATKPAAKKEKDSSDSDEFTVACDPLYVTKRADASFAPRDFQFKAPANLSSMIFKPLSPASTASFLFPENASAVGSSPSFNRRCSTPKVTGVHPLKLPRSPLASAIYEVSSAESSSPKHNVVCQGEAPVMKITPPERSRKSVHKIQEQETTMEKKHTPRRKSSRLADDTLLDNTDNYAEKSVFSRKQRTRKSLRQSVVQPAESEHTAESDLDSTINLQSEECSTINNSSQGSTTKDEQTTKSAKKSKRKSRKASLQVTVDVSSVDEEEAESSFRKRRSKRKSLRRSVVVMKQDNPVNEPLELSAKSIAPVLDKEKGTEMINPLAVEMATDEAVSSTTALIDTSIHDVHSPLTKATSDEGVVSSTMPDGLLGNAVAATVADKENADDSSKSLPLPDASVFTTPRTPPSMAHLRQRSRLKSTGSIYSGKKTPKNNRSSLILRALSPEEGIEVLKCSPMVELSRRKTPKSDTPSSMPSFDDMDELFLSEADLTTGSSSSSSANVPACTEASPMVVSTEAPSAEPITSQTQPEVMEKAEVAHDIPYFRSLLVTETARLRQLCDGWEANNTTDNLLEEVQGQIRTSIGCAQLLIAQRFKQFSGLVDNCEFNTGEKEIHCSDLQGFWDMIFFQVEDVDAKFADLQKRKENNWKDDKTKIQPKKKVIKKKAVGKVGATKPQAKSKFAAFRAKMKQQKETPAVITDNVASPAQLPAEAVKNDIKTFDAGFFKIDSPVSSPVVLSEGASPCLQRRSITGGSAPSSGKLLKNVLEKSHRRSAGLPQNANSENTTPVNSSQKKSSSNGKRKLEDIQVSSDTLVRSSKRRQSVRSAKKMPALGVDEPSLFTPAPGHEHHMEAASHIQPSTCTSPQLPMDVDETATNTSPQTADSFMKYLEPCSNQEPSVLSEVQEVDMAASMKRSLRAEFDEQSSPSVKRSTRRSVSRLSLEKLPSSAKRLEKSASGRRSRHRSVQFQSLSTTPPQIHSSATKAPVTPFNTDSLVPRQRKLSGCNSSDQLDKENVLFTPLEESVQQTTNNTPSTLLSRLNMENSPQDFKRSKRAPSLLFTPYQKPKTPLRMSSVSEEAAVDLMSFTPSDKDTDSQSSGTDDTSHRRSRRSTRSSML